MPKRKRIPTNSYPKKKKRNKKRSEKQNKYNEKKNHKETISLNYIKNIQSNNIEENYKHTNLKDICKTDEESKNKNLNIIHNYQNLYEFNNLFIDNNLYRESFISDDIIVKEITGDGNCFYNAISYYFHLTEEYNKEYRQIIYEICLESFEQIKEFIHSDYDEPNANLQDRINKAKKYIDDIKKDGNWASDFEINKMAELMNINILCYTKNENQFKLQAVYFGTNDKKNLIPLRFINRGHFEILYPKNYCISLTKLILDKEDLKKKIKYNQENIKLTKNNKVEDIPNFFNNKYVDYIYTYPNKYNEIYEFLNNNKYPIRLENIKDRKKRQKKKS